MKMLKIYKVAKWYENKSIEVHPSKNVYLLEQKSVINGVKQEYIIVQITKWLDLFTGVYR